ncbi:MAG: YggS family pyridoxal phosphate-dependent enzyme [Armatimonadetes bacterium]|nr:YggS family pyridoxal phosphate-dependent enzyme [Armatimonadota bacterium]
MGGIADRLADVQQRIAEAARRVGRDPQEARLVAVSKTHPVELVREAIAAGVGALGENYVQELVNKREAIGDAVEWHFIGHLQTNKARQLVPFCALVHGVDSLRLAEELDGRAARLGRCQPVLIEVNLSGEGTKFGVGEADVIGLAQAISRLPNVELRGLMTMPPFPAEPEDSRPYFIAMRVLREKLREAGIAPKHCAELSMGMTADYEIAVEEGATLVRVGTAIFGSRDAPNA